jgi:hypothetical protein
MASSAPVTNRRVRRVQTMWMQKERMERVIRMKMRTLRRMMMVGYRNSAVGRQRRKELACSDRGIEGCVRLLRHS